MTLKTQIMLTAILSMVVAGGGAAAIAEPLKSPHPLKNSAELSSDTDVVDTNITSDDAEATKVEATEPEAAVDEIPFETGTETREASDMTEAEGMTEAEDVTKASDPPLEAIQRSATLSLKDALSILDSEISAADEEARSAIFIGDLEQPIIAVEVGMQAIAIDANAGAVLSIQELDEIPNPEILAAAETSSMLKRYAKVTLEEALRAAESFAGEEAQQVALGLDNGSLVYRARVAEQDVFVDAGDAQVLYTSHDHVEADAKPSGSIQVSDLEETPIQ